MSKSDRAIAVKKDEVEMQAIEFQKEIERLVSEDELCTLVPEVKFADMDFWSQVFEGLKVNYQQKRFVLEFVANGGNGTEAALKVYDYKTKGVASTSSNRLLRNVQIKTAIERAVYTSGITEDWINMHLAKVVRDGDEQTKDRLTALKLLSENKGIKRSVVRNLSLVQNNNQFDVGWT